MAVDSPVNLRAAVVQLTSTGDFERNRETAERLVRAAAGDGADLVLLPEKWVALGEGDVLRANAQPATDGPAARWARDIARELRIDLVAGSFSTVVEDDARMANTSLHVSPDGELVAEYRKLHMFDSQVDGVSYRESEHERGGERMVLSATAGGVELGLSVCYDLRFPELYRALAIAGARVLTVPAAFTYATTLQHWEPLLRARAIENQCYVLAANQIGEHAPGMRSGGRSMVVDPWGVVLATVPDTEGYAVCDLDLARLDEIREQIPSLANRRDDVYATEVVDARRVAAR